MIAAALFCVCAGLFSVKIIWNLVLPYAMAVRAARAQREQGVSVMAFLEVVLLACCVGLSWVAEWPMSAGRVAAYGAALVVASYLHMVLAGTMVGFLARKARKGQ